MRVVIISMRQRTYARVRKFSPGSFQFNLLTLFQFNLLYRCESNGCCWDYSYNNETMQNQCASGDQSEGCYGENDPDHCTRIFIIRINAHLYSFTRSLILIHMLTYTHSHAHIIGVNDYGCCWDSNSNPPRCNFGIVEGKVIPKCFHPAADNSYCAVPDNATKVDCNHLNRFDCENAGM